MRTSVTFFIVAIALLVGSNLLSIEASREVLVTKESVFDVLVSNPPRFFHLLSMLNETVPLEAPCSLTIHNRGNTSVRVAITPSNMSSINLSIPPGGSTTSSFDDSNIYIEVADPGSLVFDYRTSFETRPHAILVIPAILLFVLGSVTLILGVLTYVYERE
ncbi:hypothetical protein WLZ34_05010 [Thermogladius sp. KZ2Tp1]|uniref:hypothetical protein n=1 Tax=unclassified Thermogladius TaxID=2647734 RepID=UPI003D11BBA6